MSNPKGPANFRNLMQNGKNSLLPPKCPFPSITSSYSDYGPNTSLGSKPTSKCRDGNAYHQRTSSESLLDEQPSWLDDLLNEPDTPVRKGHRRSSSDSFAYCDAGSMPSMDYMAPMTVSHDENIQNKFRPMVSAPLWGSQNFDLSKETPQGSLYHDLNFYGKRKNKALEMKLAPANHTSGLRLSRDNAVTQSVGGSAAPLEAYPVPAEKQYQSDSGIASEKKDGSHAKTPSENDTKRAKQQFAQRSRVRKLQYIAELENNAEGSEVSAELEFLNQQNLILSMENKALKQRLESLSQEKLIKYNKLLKLGHNFVNPVLSLFSGMLDCLEAVRSLMLRPSSSHRRTNSRDLDSQFANLNLKHKESSSGPDSFSGPVGLVPFDVKVSP
uniref:BZIP domain-containing protein n=1 Tax=Chenopodium quinoa TaxID=63459 RepID=A0A803LNG3_CHEQI